MLLRSPRWTGAFWIAWLAILRLVVIPPERRGTEDEATIRRAAEGATAWMVRHQRPDGSYLYEYDRGRDATSSDYNEVRHAGVTMALYQAAGRMRDASALAAADRGLAWMEAGLVRRGDWVALAPGRRSAPLGASALMLVGLTERRLLTGDHGHDDRMRELARFLVSEQAADGSFSRGYDLVADAVERGSSTYYPGESLWALALTNDAFPGEGWDRAADAALHYIATRRDEDEGEDYPPFNDQWAAYGIAELARTGKLDAAEIDYAHRLAARFGLLARTEAQRAGSGRGELLRGELSRGARAGTWLEGLAALWRASRLDPRLADLSAPLADRARALAGIMAARQSTREDAAAFPRPALVEGAWFSDDETRMDDQQHAFSGLLYTLDVVEGRAAREPERPVVP